MPSPEPGRNSPCPCGTGKKFKHCCGGPNPHNAASTQNVPAQPAVEPPIDGRLQQAMALLQQGKLPQATRLLKDLVAARPQDPAPHYLLGYAALQNQRPAQAAADMRRALDLGLSDPAAFYHYGSALAALGDYQPAAAAFEKALAQKPDFLAARSNLANCYFEMREFTQAEANYRLTLAAEPGNLVACHNLGQVFFVTQRIDEAISYFQKAADVAPNVAELWASLATMQEAENDLTVADANARKALALEPHNVTAAIALSRVLRRSKKPLEAIAALDGADLKRGMPRSAIAYWAERGNSLELLARHQEAFDAFAKCKYLLAEARIANYDPRATESALVDERLTLTPDRVNAWSLAVAPGPTAAPTPIFIVGFPRSGTTLLEQMLGCHTQVVPCGELVTCVEREASSTNYPANLVALDDAARTKHLAALRDEYLAELRMHGTAKPDARYATDKLPLNLMRIGLIRLLFPEARIIHVMRHPLDAIVSAYFTAFQFGNDWSLKLADTAHLFHQSWHHAQAMRDLPGVNFLRIRYEDLVSEPEPILKQVLYFLDLDWEPECLAFHQSQRVARTASYAQVNRPLYQTSKKRYRHYLEHFDASTLEMLAPILRQTGYELERPLAVP